MDHTIIKATLDRYYKETGSYIDRDNGASTMISIGCVLLASIMAATRCPEVIASLTALPTEFVAAVWMVNEACEHIFSLHFADLVLAASNLSFDIAEVEEILGDLLVEISKPMEPQWWRILKNLRAGVFMAANCSPSRMKWRSSQSVFIEAPNVNPLTRWIHRDRRSSRTAPTMAPP